MALPRASRRQRPTTCGIHESGTAPTRCRGCSTVTEHGTIAFSSRTGRLLLTVTILASGMGFLDSTVVNVALPKIESELGGGLATIQWVLDSYALTLGALVLVGGALGDALGRKRVFLWGVSGFAATSVLCGIAPTAGTLIAARALQGVAAAMMIPGSLALISALFRSEDRGRAIGAWSGLAGLVTVLGPVIGGLLVDSGEGGWRWAFLINLPIAVLVLLLARTIPTPDKPELRLRTLRRVDFTGAVLTTLALLLIVTPLIEYQRLPLALVLILVMAGLVVFLVFWVVEARRERGGTIAPMMPPSLWRIRSFSMANIITLFVYGALGAVLLLFVIGFQIGLGWSALAAGAAGLPITLILAAFSARVGALLPRVGSRNLLTLGAGLVGLGAFVLAWVPSGASYWLNVLPGILVFGAGLVFMVAPITTTALGDIPVKSSGIGSGVNNSVARIAGLIAVALVPLTAGLTHVDANAGAAVLPGYRRGMLICAVLMWVGGLLSWFGFDAAVGRVGEGDQEPSPDVEPGR